MPLLGSQEAGEGSVATAAGLPPQGTPGGPFPGYGGAPPAVAPASSAGTSPLASRSDHTHAQSFGAAPPAVGASTAGVGTTASRFDHGHPILTVADAAAMAALVVTAMPDGTPCYVASRDGVFRLATSARTTNTWDTFASATAGRQWLRDGYVSLKNGAVTAWGINTTTGSDDAVGGVGTPLKTVAELAWRLYGSTLPASVTATIVGSMVAADLPLFTFKCLPAATFTLTFTPVVIYTSTMGVPVAAGAGPGTGDNNFPDAAVPGGSFTAAGAMASGVIGTRTNGTAAFFWFALDKGATTARISKPSAALANGDTYTASTLPTANAMRFAEQRYSAVNIQFAKCTTGPWTDSSLRFDRCWFTSGASLPGVTYSNCAFEGSVLVNQGASVRGLNFAGNGMARGTGAQAMSITLGVATGGITGSMTFQGIGLIAQDGFFSIDTDQYCNDFTGAGGGCFTASYWGIILWKTGGLVGSGNTNYLLYADRMSQIASVTNPVVVAGSSPSATPIHVTGYTDFSVANLANGAGVLGAGGLGVYYTNINSVPFLAGAATANGAVASVFTANVGATGNNTAIQRWVKAPDGAGGFFTWPSWT